MIEKNIIKQDNQSEKTLLFKEFINIIWILIASCVAAFGLHIFVYSSDFAPSGVDGIAAMLQKISGWSAGIFAFSINTPLLVAAFFVLKRKYVVYTLIYTTVSSLLIYLLSAVNFYQYISNSDMDYIICTVVSGVLLGIRTGIMLKIGGSSGGVDTIACFIQKKWSHINVERIISILCYITIGVSYFVYGNVISVFLAVIQMVISERITTKVLADTRNAMEIKIVTKNPNDIKNDILFNLKHGATIVESKGALTDQDSSIIFSVINIRQIPDFLNMIKKYPDTFVYFNDVKGVKGNFRWFKDDEVK